MGPKAPRPPGFAGDFVAFLESFGERRRRKQEVARLEVLGFSFALRMLLTVTDRRIIVTEAITRGFRPGRHLCDIPIADVEDLWFPYSGGGKMRTMALRLRSGQEAEIKVPADQGEPLRQAVGVA